MKSYPILVVVLAVVAILVSGCSNPTEQKNASEGPFGNISSSQYKPVTIASSTTVPSSAAAGYITYENPTYGIKMTYPAYLKKQEEISGEIVFFISPQDSTTDAFPANLDIIVQNISSEPVSLDEFTNFSIGQIGEMVPDYNITDSRKATLSKEDAHLLSYTGTQGLLKLKWLSVYTIKNDTLYLVTYTAGADKFAKYLPVVSKMLDSFEIIG
jgi:eukaryotic-like serine/threonine-protein kinase